MCHETQISHMVDSCSAWQEWMTVSYNCIQPINMLWPHWQHTTWHKWQHEHDNDSENYLLVIAISNTTRLIHCISSLTVKPEHNHDYNVTLKYTCKWMQQFQKCCLIKTIRRTYLLARFFPWVATVDNCTGAKQQDLVLTSFTAIHNKHTNHNTANGCSKICFRCKCCLHNVKLTFGTAYTSTKVKR